MTLENLLNFSLGLIDNLIIFLFVNSLFMKKFKCKLPLIFAISICSVFIFLIDDFNIILKCFLSFCELMICFSILYKEKLFVKVSFALTSLYTLYIVDIVVGNMFTFILGDTFFEVFYSDLSNRIIVCLIIKLLNAGVFWLIYKMFANSHFNFSSANWWMYNIVTSVLLIISMLFLNLYASAQSEPTTAFLLFLLSLMIFIMGLVVISFFTRLSASFQREKRAFYQQTNYAELQNMFLFQNQTNQKLRKFRHDLKNHLSNVLFLIKKEEYSTAYELLKDFTSYAEETTFDLKSSTSNSLIDAIIAFKATICESKSINFQYTLEPLPELHVDILNLSALMSNLFDNAIEASEKTETPIITLKIFAYKGYISIILSNTFNPGNILYFDSNFKTLKQDKENHGFGSQIIKEICDKYNGTYNRDIKDNIFTVNILLGII